MPPHPPTRVPSGLLGMLAIVLVLDVGFFRADRFSTDQAASWRFKGAWARGRSVDADVLVFGDSLMEFGVLPAVLRERSGLRVMNLATHNGNAAVSYFLLRRALESGARPRAILVDFMPHQLAKSPSDATFDRSWPELLTARESMDLASSLGDPSRFARTLVAQALGTVAARHEVRASLMANLRGGSYSAKAKCLLLRRNWEANLGAQVAPATVSRTIDRFDGLFPDSWQLDVTTEAYLRRFLALAEARGVPVFWVIPPIRPGAQAWREARALDGPYLAFIDRLMRAHPSITLIDGRSCGYPDALFSDAVHLNRDGAEGLSEGIARVLAAPPQPGTTARLGPAGRRERPAVGVEDMRESSIALRSAERNTRPSRERPATR